MRPVRSSVRSFWFHGRILVGACLLVIYVLAIFFDLPTPAGSRYRQDLPDRVLVAWGATPSPSAQLAPHWWDKIQGLRGWSNNPEGWSWAKLNPAPPWNWIILFGFGFLGAAGLILLEYLDQRESALVSGGVIIFLILFSYTFQLLTLQLKSTNSEQLLIDRIADKYFTGYFNSALQFDDLKDYFSNYGSTLKDPAYCSHCQTHPPGPVLFYWSIHHLVNDTLPVSWQDHFAEDLHVAEHVNPDGLPTDAFLVAWLGANIILFSAATIVIPLYGLARRLGTRKLALPLAALGVVIPGIILMSPEFDQVYATFTAWLFYLAIRGIDSYKQKFRWGLFTGIVLAFGLFWSISFWVLLVPLGMLVLVALTARLTRYNPQASDIPGRMNTIEVGKWLLGMGLGTALPWVLLIIFGKFPILAVASAVRRDHLNGITAVRSYVPWLVFNLVDFVQFLGIPLAFVTMLTFFIQPIKIRQETTLRIKTLGTSYRNLVKLAVNWFMSKVNIYGFIFWSVVIILDLSGTTRGEVGRLWIFLMPLALLAVYHSAGQGRLNRTHIHLLLASQFLVCILLGGNWLTP